MKCVLQPDLLEPSFYSAFLAIPFETANDLVKAGTPEQGRPLEEVGIG